jgi:NADH-quinone oxidoreductase subunit C
MEDILKRMEERFALGEIDRARPDLVFVTVPKPSAAEAVTWLRDYEGFTHLVLVSAVDRIERGIFQLTYLLHNYAKKRDIGVRVEIGRDNAVMDGIHHLWATAAVYQRELKEMFGIDFPGSPRVDEPMILEGWDDTPPMRRDFDTKEYSERTFFPREGRERIDPKTEMEQAAYPLEAQVKHAIKKLVRTNR